MSSPLFFHAHYLARKIKHYNIIVNFVYKCYSCLDLFYIKMISRNIKCLECNKNNKQYINISWDSLDYVWDDTHNKLDTTLDELKE